MCIYIFQRIEAWWGQLRKNGASWWMDFFKVTLFENFSNVAVLIGTEKQWRSR